MTDKEGVTAETKNDAGSGEELFFFPKIFLGISQFISGGPPVDPRRKKGFAAFPANPFVFWLPETDLNRQPSG